jgi:hypothetical protein
MHASSDSVTDLRLLEVVGHPRVLNPGRALRKVATARGWPVLAARRHKRQSGGPAGAGLAANGDKAPGNVPPDLRI